MKKERIYFWLVAILAFAIGLLAGYGIGFKIFFPEFLESSRTPLVIPKTHLPEKQLPVTFLSDQEKELIDQWIALNNLNEYGDPKGTMYTGGTPLFDEETGRTLDRYQYILEKHPDRPWLQLRETGSPAQSE